MSLSWEQLLKIDYGVAFSKLDVQVSHVIQDSYYKIDSNKYIFAYPAEGGSTIIFCGFAWVASDGVAKWIFSKDAQADDKENVAPPETLLPDSGINTYQSLVEYGKRSDPENFYEVVLGACQVSFSDFTYFFRKGFPDKRDYPIGIKVDLRPWKHLKA